MKQFKFALLAIGFGAAFTMSACEKSGSDDSPGKKLSGRALDAAGRPLAGVKVTVEHTVFFGNYVLATTDADGRYSVEVPATPAGSWTAKAQLEKTAYGQDYKFDMAVSSTEAFTANQQITRDFTWRLSGPRPVQGQHFGAHADLYLWGTDVEMEQVKLRFTPVEPLLIDGTPAAPIERLVQNVAGTYMVNDIPVGKYRVRAVYPGKSLLLDNRDDDGQPEAEKTFVFGKNAQLAETEYNVEFWLTE